MVVGVVGGVWFPRAGAWMDQVKGLFGFLLIFSALWASWGATGAREGPQETPEEPRRRPKGGLGRVKLSPGAPGGRRRRQVSSRRRKKLRKTLYCRRILAFRQSATLEPPRELQEPLRRRQNWSGPGAVKRAKISPRRPARGPKRSPQRLRRGFQEAPTARQKEVPRNSGATQHDSTN